ncbi:uncharacterized protein MYCFIDRAFT_203819 [Pseudocercospora fijiensis CIRAD86]|uniref:Uncharacterized protein n=1 Tax=Pseudocercospora fijiensis (strain CIRAD86) TaxID=383855 RepID=M3AXK5_PSEFD|nr:uncharacterized protein MYCFIDRAFT_203819 [Pseudocercospora fijiensis CIRAD86]EME81828.1 hypothetical protein MYCFIDRAFT_203819 [Pseudocercospora fijiensis CIRAD86]
MLRIKTCDTRYMCVSCGFGVAKARHTIGPWRETLVCGRLRSLETTAVLQRPSLGTTKNKRRSHTLLTSIKRMRGSTCSTERIIMCPTNENLCRTQPLAGMEARRVCCMTVSYGICISREG